ncbi:MAG: glucodextranase DOMON-like domain-containing protein [Anaerolineaceae bacterium]|nr:glucodextranase DOMON-like domain-containing protein [Anaerolineaceae bacterium]
MNRNKKTAFSAVAFLLFFNLLGACAGPAKPATNPDAPGAQPGQYTPVSSSASQLAVQPKATEAAAGQMPLSVNITWHMHQPFYYKDENGVYTRPWVRVHATKDYLDMAELIARYPGMHATINITPSLIEQLDDFTKNGAKDIYWVLAEKPASTLTDSEKTFIMQHFFDVNWEQILARYLRYKELLNKRGGTDAASIARAVSAFKEEDWRDLQIWFNLAWIDPGYLAMDPFKALVAKGKNFSEEDKKPLFEGILALMKRIIPTYKDLQDKGIIEITTTPYAHPILPLIVNMQNALMGNPQALLPITERVQGAADADEQVALAAKIYREHFGREPRGLWPGEGAVSEDIIPKVTANGFTYIQSGEPVLVRSLGLSGERFERDENELVIDANTAYRPYVFSANGASTVLFFRDWNISDKIGFSYASMPGRDAARDFISRLEAVQSKITGADKIISIIVDGENCWENYDMDGKEFLTEIYQRLSAHPKLTPVTPSGYLKSALGMEKLKTLFPGAWFSPNYDTWIGEKEEAQAWELLAQTRNFLAAYQKTHQSALSQPDYRKAYLTVLQAEGSDWFWWYGADQDSGQDAYFDLAYRELLKKVYTSLGEEPPANLDIPLVPAQSLKPEQSQTGALAPRIDGKADKDEWKQAAQFKWGEDSPIKAMYYGTDEENLYLRFDLKKALSPLEMLEIYFGLPDTEPQLIKSVDGQEKLAGSANLALILNEKVTSYRGVFAHTVKEGKWDEESSYEGTWEMTEAGIVEASVPLKALKSPQAGASLPMQMILKQEGRTLLPKDAVFDLQFMHFGPLTNFLDIEDPSGDDKGPGSYTYPKDAIFIPGVFDLTRFSVGSDGTNLVFTFGIKGPITNGWNSPAGYSVQTFDVYIDKDPGKATGERLLLPGRNAALPQENGWEFALWAEGWQPKWVQPGEKAGKPTVNESVSAQIKQVVDSGKNTVVVMVPLTAFGEGDPKTWAYAATLAGQEGYPAEGVWRIRDVKANADQYKFGGAKEDANHTRIIDFARPAGMPPEQYPSLNSYKSSKETIGAIPADDFAIVPMLEGTVK